MHAHGGALAPPREVEPTPPEAPALPPPTPLEVTDKLRAEALEVYQSIGDRLLRGGEAVDFLLHAMDNGMPFDRDHIPPAPETEPALERARAFLRRVRAADPTPRHFVAEERRELDRHGEPRDVLAVTFELAGTEALARELPNDPAHRPPLASDAGNLLVHLKRIDGRWYWNFFGW